MGAALNSLLDETKADGTYKRIFDEVASNTTETLGCAPQVPFETPEAHNLFLAVWYGHFFLHTTPCLPSHHSVPTGSCTLMPMHCFPVMTIFFLCV